jgi:ribosomal protein S27E
MEEQKCHHCPTTLRFPRGSDVHLDFFNYIYVPETGEVDIRCPECMRKD